MKKFHKPDIKGMWSKVRNLKKEDVKEYLHQRKVRREMILEKRRNSAFAKKMQPVYRFMNRISILMHALLACVINFFYRSNLKTFLHGSMGLYDRITVGIFI